MNARLKTAGIIGTGLIGGSIGLRARRAGMRVAGYDADAAALSYALEAGIIDVVLERDRIYEQSDIVVLAMPVREAITELEMLDPAALDRVRVVMDVASVKAPIVHAARGLSKFVATHPMAGNEGIGPAAADAALFEGKTWAYVEGADAQATRDAVDFIRVLSGVPLRVDAETHDATVALTSHVPQIFAWAFERRLRELPDPDAASLCGQVARDLLRVGQTHPPFWDGVLELNAAHVARELHALAEDLSRVTF